MPAPVVRFDPVEGSLRIDLSPTCGISVDYPRGLPPSFSIYKAGREMAPDDLDRKLFCDLVRPRAALKPPDLAAMASRAYKLRHIPRRGLANHVQAQAYLAIRKPCGRLRHDPHSQLLSPTEARRLFDAASTGLRDPIWATMLGRLYRDGKIISSQFAAGKRWCELTANYSVACRSPSPPRSLSLYAIRDMPIDPDTATGAQEVARHERASAAYIEGRHVLRLAGRDAERVVDDVCARDCALAGFGELNALRAGLAALAALWSAKRKASAR